MAPVPKGVASARIVTRAPSSVKAAAVPAREGVLHAGGRGASGKRAVEREGGGGRFTLTEDKKDHYRLL